MPILSESESKSLKELPNLNNFTPKIIFFDIDDTLSRKGVLAPQNKATLQALATHTDIKIVIATGRSKPMLPEDILELHDNGVIDAIVCMNGQYSFTKHHPEKKGDEEHLIKHYPLTLEQSEKIATICNEQQVTYKFESTTHVGWSADDEPLRKLIAENSHYKVDPHFHRSNDVYQGSVFLYDEMDKMQHVDFAKHGLKLVFWNQVGADILPVNASKARAVKDVCAYYNIDPSEAMAFGDSHNDIEMFDLVGFAVAMGDGQPALMERADMVTGTIEENGIGVILERFYG